MIRKTKNSGFSLMELLVVIAIIAILVTIMFPSISAFRERAYKAKSIGAFQELSNAALQYKSDNEYYPGQQMDPNGITGSQMLAACLLDGVVVNYTSGKATGISDTSDPASNYIEYSTDRFKEIEGKRLTPSDLWKSDEEMAVLYYPSNLGNDGETIGTAATAVFNPNINSVYGKNLPTSNETNANGDVIVNLISGKFGDDEVVNSDSFLLIAPSLDRHYFKYDDKCDDIKNY